VHADGQIASPLRRAREARGWSQAATMRRFTAAVRRLGGTCPEGESLRRMFAYWESGQRSVHEPLYQRAFIEVFAAPAEALGLAVAVHPELEVLADGLRLFTIDAELVALVERQTDTLRLTDRRVGTAVLLNQAEAHVAQIETLLHQSVGGERERLAAALAEAAALAGWLALDHADIQRAWHLHEQAKSAAHESGDRDVLAHVTAQQACVLLDSSEPAAAAAVIEHARSLAGDKAPRLLRAWLVATKAECHAAQGESRLSRNSMNVAEGLASSASAETGLSFLMLTDGHLARWHGHCLARLGDPGAIGVLTSAQADASDSVRAMIGLNTDLALAMHRAGRVDEAAAVARRASDLATLHGSRRQRRRLAPLQLTRKCEEVQQADERS
jgi:hypothetical protein